MDPFKKLGTPRCPAEHRAWLLIYQKRLGLGRQLTEAFEKQFWDRRQDNIIYHAGYVRDADEDVQSQSLELAKRCSWYEDSPQEGTRGYKRMKRYEKHQEARKRLKSRRAGVRKNAKV